VSSPSPISETERAVLKALWDHGPGTVRELHTVLGEQGSTWAYTTVQTLLARLAGKGYVECDRSAAAHVYKAAVTLGELLQQKLTDLAATYCEGTSSPLMLALVEGSRFSPEEITKFRELLDKLEAEPADQPRKGGRK
jgi:BlaI family transcriptional regulator, penicillinase repressor